ncbi:MAG TPA: DNA polymerase III subunit delta' [Clostridia bacterium]|nr:DNA polymerase III subunit delta' [Clostridia bacterium]
MNNFDIIGQSPLMDRIESILHRGRIVHSYIFTGPKGVGKTTMSNFFAKAILCLDKEVRPCNKCLSCRQFESGNHPDLTRISSENKSIKVDSIRGMRGDIGIKPFQGEWKVYIIEKGDTMNTQAQNALLKTLEEPPEYAIIIILSNELTGLLPTIVSRCQHMRVPRLSHKDVAGIIQKRTEIPFDEALVFSKLSQGIPGKGLEIAESQEYHMLRDQSLSIIEDLAGTTLVGVFEHVDFFQDNREDIMNILDMLELWMRDILIIKATHNKDILINIDKLDRLKSLSSTFTIEDIQCIIENIGKSKTMLMSNVNFQFTIENLLINIQGRG